MGSWRATTAAIVTGLFLCWTPATGTATDQLRTVSMELVLAIDSSASVDGSEYELQLRGIASAFRRPEIISTIAQHPDGVAVALVHWGGWAESILDPPWRLLENRAAVLDFAKEIEEVRRRHVGHLTAIGHAIDVSIELIETNNVHGRQRKIDVSGDGRNNSGRMPREVHRIARSKGITINGLAILTDDPGLFEYYRTEVIDGPSRFVLRADTYDDFAVAMAKKLHRELMTPIASVPRQKFPARPPADRKIARRQARRTY
ncbi:MAG: DUF1194 domain-containing protein [Hyphomicrobiaceae bacterium]